MKFTQFLPAEGTQAALDENKHRYQARHATPSYRDFAIGLAAKEAGNQETGGYLKFGPYWWALKAILNANGYYYGDHMDGLIAATYSVKDEKGGIDEMLTITAAFAFRDHYLDNFFIGTSQIELFGDGQFYILEDLDINSV